MSNFFTNKINNDKELTSAVRNRKKYDDSIKKSVYKKLDCILNEKLGKKTNIMLNTMLFHDNDLNEEQNVALSIMVNSALKGENIFLTGEAGTGKSYLVRKFIKLLEQQRKNVVITAMSGIAAVNIGGSTIHRAFQAPTHPFIDTSVVKAPEIIKKADVILIDEISMVRADLFEYVVLTIKRAEKLVRKKISLIVVGDFFQLPPVLTENDKLLLVKKYANIVDGYAFETQYWYECNFHNIRLSTVVRQDDKELKDNLNMIRNGDFSAVSYFSKYSTRRIPDAITVCGRNNTAKKRNIDSLKKLTTKQKDYFATEGGTIEDKDRSTERQLTLKSGARVLMLTNDSQGKWYNGSLGTVISLGEDSIKVKIDGKSVEEVKKHRWNIEEYYVRADNSLGKYTIGFFEQLPVKLAYAITIHKSQGQTFEKMNLIPECWVPGQLYVALSRIKNISNFCLEGEIKPGTLIASKEVLMFYDSIKFENESMELNDENCFLYDENILSSYIDILKKYEDISTRAEKLVSELKAVIKKGKYMNSENEKKYVEENMKILEKMSATLGKMHEDVIAIYEDVQTFKDDTENRLGLIEQDIEDLKSGKYNTNQDSDVQNEVGDVRYTKEYILRRFPGCKGFYIDDAIPSIAGTKPKAIVFVGAKEIIETKNWKDLLREAGRFIINVCTNDEGKLIKETREKDDYDRWLTIEGDVETENNKYVYVLENDVSLLSNGATQTVETLIHICELSDVDLKTVLIIYS